MDKRTDRALEKTIKYSRIAAYWNRKAVNYEARAHWIESATEREEKKAREAEQAKKARKAKANRPLSERIGCGEYPAALVWWDNGREKRGDYVTLARMSYTKRVLEFTDDCKSPEVREIIQKQAAAYLESTQP